MKTRTSYGVILYSRSSLPTPTPTPQTPLTKFLLVQRKYSYAYDALIRGHFNFDDISYLKLLISEITPAERRKLLTYDHDYLWNKLWSFTVNNNMFIKEYEAAKHKFNILLEDLETLFKTIPAKWQEPEWGFPKGKKNFNEKPYDTAFRELLEESGLSANTVTIHKEDELQPIHEEFVGTDGVNYHNIYYIGKSTLPGIGFVNPWGLHQIAEVNKIGWFSYNEAKTMFRDQNNACIDALETLSKMLEEC